MGRWVVLCLAGCAHVSPAIQRPTPAIVPVATKPAIVADNVVGAMIGEPPSPTSVEHDAWIWRDDDRSSYDSDRTRMRCGTAEPIRYVYPNNTIGGRLPPARIEPEPKRLVLVVKQLQGAKETAAELEDPALYRHCFPQADTLLVHVVTRPEGKLFTLRSSQPGSAVEACVRHALDGMELARDVASNIESVVGILAR